MDKKIIYDDFQLEGLDVRIASHKGAVVFIGLGEAGDSRGSEDWFSVRFGGDLVRAKDEDKDRALLDTAAREIGEYLRGDREVFDFPIELNGTPFQKQVWKEMLMIPYGETISYQQLARLVGSPKAARAVGGAVAANRIGICVPCHRICPSTGETGEFAWGAHIKKRLIELESLARRRSELQKVIDMAESDPGCESPIGEGIESC